MLEFDHEAVDWCQVVALPFGDYWCVLKDDHVVPFVFERKATNDFFSSFSGRYEYEKDKLLRCRDAGMDYIVILEGSLSEILKGDKHCSKEGISLIRTMKTWEIKFYCGDNDYARVVWCNDRKEMTTHIEESFYAYGKRYYERRKDKARTTPQVESKV